jgi:hypothetical protein
MRTKRLILAALFIAMLAGLMYSVKTAGAGDPVGAGVGGMPRSASYALKPTASLTRAIIVYMADVDWKNLTQSIMDNPPLLAAMLAIITNIGMYIAACANSKKLEPYDKTKFLETLAIFETVLITIQGLAGLPASWAATLALVLSFVRSLKNAISTLSKSMAPQTASVSKAT